ncbi:MAG: chemotaxis protein CheB [Alphaproteobacteria bacterium]|nr:chemotaxis protein CheB [Alphaproteobacteria bacterium]
MPKIIAIGASQGGVQVLQKIAAGLPSDLSVPVLVVLHVGAEPSQLPSILSDAGPLPAAHAKNGEIAQPGRIYVAPPDHHLLVADGRLHLSHGPRENFVRPAIDPLFRTVAEYYDGDAIGVVLTGRLNDGTSGLFEIKRRGGIAIVQNPMTAEAPPMPKSAMDNVAVDFCLPVDAIAEQLVRLTREKTPKPSHETRGAPVMREEKPPLATPVAQTCPECGGAMMQENLGNLTRFRCHIGHIMTAEILAAGQLDALENSTASVLRFLNERSHLCRHMADKHFANGNRAAGEMWQRAAEEATVREEAVRELTQADWTRPEDAAV